MKKRQNTAIIKNPLKTKDAISLLAKVKPTAVMPKPEAALRAQPNFVKGL